MFFFGNLLKKTIGIKIGGGGGGGGRGGRADGIKLFFSKIESSHAVKIGNHESNLYCS